VRRVRDAAAAKDRRLLRLLLVRLGALPAGSGGRGGLWPSERVDLAIAADPPPAARLVGQVGPAALLGVWLLSLLLAAVDDRRTRRRVHGAYVVGAAVLLVGFTRVLVME